MEYWNFNKKERATTNNTICKQNKTMLIVHHCERNKVKTVQLVRHCKMYVIVCDTPSCNVKEQQSNCIIKLRKFTTNDMHKQSVLTTNKLLCYV